MGVGGLKRRLGRQKEWVRRRRGRCDQRRGAEGVCACGGETAARRERLFAAATSKANANEPLGDSRRRLCFQHPALPLSPACIYLAAPSSSPGSNCGSTPSFSVRGRPALPRPAPPAKTSGSNRPLIKSCNSRHNRHSNACSCWSRRAERTNRLLRVHEVEPYHEVPRQPTALHCDRAGTTERTHGTNHAHSTSCPSSNSQARPLFESVL